MGSIKSNFSQITNTQQLGGGTGQINTITTAVPFLLISPDSRSGAMGDAGVAISPDANAIHWNPAKLVFIDPNEDIGFSLSYTPWLRALVNDINLAYLAGFKRLDRFSTIGASLRYFSLGSITFTDNFGSTIRDFKPSEFALDLVYSRKLSDNFSAGISARYINSNLTGGTMVAGANTKAGQSGSTDLSLYYISNPFKIADKNSKVAFGTNISNIGAKISYTDSDQGQGDFLPINLKLGSTINTEIDEFNQFSFSVDLNKLLVPTNPIYERDANGNYVFDASGNPVVFSGRDPNVGVATGMFGSFTDAPGIAIYDDDVLIGIEDGSILMEELREINISLGAEFLYSELFALRAGYFHEHPTKGNRRFISFGAGVKYKVLELDLSYILALTQQSPLANTIRFSIKLNMGGSETKE
ncbi:MAG: hypothetical protein CL832_02045 [Crocinitomicaceae bacterium]|nr:hypothetical protein [Crocinitomicaceae bacterium]|tara:strand:+ start:707 stop:1948 length:1242 start_codon:yes stop_codon:yes gene_type:complete